MVKGREGLVEHESGFSKYDTQREQEEHNCQQLSPALIKSGRFTRVNLRSVGFELSVGLLGVFADGVGCPEDIEPSYFFLFVIAE